MHSSLSSITMSGRSNTVPPHNNRSSVSPTPGRARSTLMPAHRAAAAPDPTPWARHWFHDKPARSASSPHATGRTQQFAARRFHRGVHAGSSMKSSCRVPSCPVRHHYKPLRPSRRCTPSSRIPARIIIMSDQAIITTTGHGGHHLQSCSTTPTMMLTGPRSSVLPAVVPVRPPRSSPQAAGAIIQLQAFTPSSTLVSRDPLNLACSRHAPPPSEMNDTPIVHNQSPAPSGTCPRHHTHWAKHGNVPRSRRADDHRPVCPNTNPRRHPVVQHCPPAQPNQSLTSTSIPCHVQERPYGSPASSHETRPP